MCLYGQISITNISKIICRPIIETIVGSNNIVDDVVYSVANKNAKNVVKSIAN